MITVDLDRASAIHLLRVFFNVPRVYHLVHSDDLTPAEGKALNYLTEVGSATGYDLMKSGAVPDNQRAYDWLKGLVRKGYANVKVVGKTRAGLYKKAYSIHALSLSELTVTFSPRGVGYHIKIPRSVSVLENLKIRALLWDDPYRLLYAFKKWTLNPDEKYVDLCFDEKVGRKEENLDLLGMIHELESPEFVRTLLYLIRKERVEEADKLVNQLAEKLNPHLNKIRGPMFVGCVAFNGDPLRERLADICTDISGVDSTFKWRMYPCFFPEFDWVLSLFGHDKDHLWRRLVWLKNKTELKEAETRLWVKERIAT